MCVTCAVRCLSCVACHNFKPREGAEVPVRVQLVLEDGVHTLAVADGQDN
jgi:hypothetical protein